QAKHDGDKDGNETVNINGDADGKLSFDLPFAKGQVKLPEGAMAHGDFDIDGVKMFPGATVTGFHVNAVNDDSVVNIAFKAPAPPEQVRAYFLGEFKKKGMTASASGDAVSGIASDGSPFTIHVQPNGAGSQGAVEIHNKD
ncbi:MAG: hypothetical protein ABIO80_08795, partial [Sphingomicrobium sp.]